MNGHRSLWLLPVAVVLGLGFEVTTNLIIALDRSRQKHTMAAQRNWGMAIEESVVSGRTRIGDIARDVHSFARKHELPLADAWGTPFRIGFARDGYTIHSAAADGEFQRALRFGPIADLDEDIVFSDGAFAQYPEGI